MIRNTTLLISILLTVILLAACGGPATPDPEPPDPDPDITWLITAAELERGTFPGRVLVRQYIDGELNPDRVADAVVTVNGTAYAFDTVSGRYTGRTGVPAGPGDSIEVIVEAGGDTITGQAVVPDLAVQTGPADGTVYAIGDEIPISWTIPADPDSYVLMFSWPAGSAPVDVSDGAAREYRHNQAGLPEGLPLKARVLSTNAGSFTGPAHPDSTLALQSYPDPASLPVFSIGPVVPTAIFVKGFDMGPRHNNVKLHWAIGDRVDTANPALVTATLNGQALVMDPDDVYRVLLAPEVPVGGTLELLVSGDGMNLRGVGTVPELPVITAPAAGTVYGPTDDLTIQWSSTADPDRFWIVLNGTGASRNFDATGSERSLTIPISELPLTTGPVWEFDIAVLAYDHGSFTGDFAADSSMNIRSSAATRPNFIITP